MSISIIIPTKNEAGNLPTLLASILNLKTLPREVIIIDNHSTDGTPQLARKIWRAAIHASQQGGVRDKFVQVARPGEPSQTGLAWQDRQQKQAHWKKPSATEQISVAQPSLLPPLMILPKGPERSVQKNFGAGKAKGSHLLFLDADMEVPPELLTELERLMYGGAQAVVIPEHAVGADFWGTAVALERNLYEGSRLLEAPRLIEKALFGKIGGYDHELVAGEDWDLARRIENAQITSTRTKYRLIHHEAQGLVPNLSRKWYYSKHIGRYARRHPARFARQSNLSVRTHIYWVSRKRLMQHPIHTFAFLLIKAITYARWRLVR